MPTPTPTAMPTMSMPMRILTIRRFLLLRWARHVHERFIFASLAFCLQWSCPGHTGQSPPFVVVFVHFSPHRWLDGVMMASMSVSKGFAGWAVEGTETSDVRGQSLVFSAVKAREWALRESSECLSERRVTVVVVLMGNCSWGESVFSLRSGVAIVIIEILQRDVEIRLCWIAVKIRIDDD